jgi:glycerol-3-phosphate acyltransferase PlsY
MTAVLVVLVSYLIGALPVAYVAGRLMRGIDLRRQGSGNVGASNVWQSVSRAAVVPVGLIEIVQGLAGILIAKAVGLDLSVQVAAGLAALAGHNWSPFLAFAGGRGIAHALGFMLVLSWPALGLFAGVALAGVALRAIPQLVGLGIVLAPLAALAAGQSYEIVAGTVALAALVFAKRLLANEAPPPGEDLRDVLLCRLLYDRDTRDREGWVRRGG